MKIENDYCMAIADTDQLKHDDWLEQRKKGIGGSDAGAIMGLNPWCSALMVYLDKMGLAPETEETDAMKHGKRMEPVLLREFPEIYFEATGIKGTTEQSPYIYQSKEHPFVLGNIDGLFIQDKTDIKGVEIKTANQFAAKEWEDCEVPDQYYAQVQHYMYLLGLETFFIPVLIGPRFDFREVPRNETFIKQMLEAEIIFWHECIEKKQMPAPSGIDNENDYLLHLYGTASDEVIELPHLENDVEKYLEINGKIKALKADKEKLQLLFKNEIGEAKGFVTPNHKVTWSRFEKTSFRTNDFKALHPELYEQFSSKSLSSRLSVK